eukprot:1194559-Prymnesium_polylepis.1
MTHYTVKGVACTSLAKSHFVGSGHWSADVALAPLHCELRLLMALHLQRFQEERGGSQLSPTTILDHRTTHERAQTLRLLTTLAVSPQERPCDARWSP